MSINYHPVVAGNQPNANAGIKENLDVGKVVKETVSAQQYVLLPLCFTGLQDPQNTNDDVADVVFDVKENENDVHVSAIGSNKSANKKHDEKAKRDDKGKTSPSINDISPKFRIAGKSSFVDPSKYPDDPDMPELEDIVYSNNDEDVGFEDLDYLDKVYKVVKALHGLHQAPRAWYETLANYRLENGFQRGNIDQTLFIKKQKGDILLVHVYVDDIIFGSTKKELCKAFKKLMKDKFQMSSMGELTFFLGLQVKQKDDGIFISQDKFVAKILRKFGFTYVKSASTPIVIEKPLLKDPDGEDVDVLIYKVKRKFRYLKGKPHLGLWYPRDSPFNLVAYSDGDYAGANLDRKSTTGGCQFLGCRLMRQCKKQTVVATSSTEAEYVAAASCCAQVLCIQNQLLDYGNVCAVRPRHFITAVSYELMLFGLTKVIAVNLMLLGHKLMLSRYALVVNPTIYVSCIMQFWATATVKKVIDAVQLRALIDGKKVVVLEAIIRRGLYLDNADGVECLPNEEIFEELTRMGRKFNFSKYIFDSMVRNVDSPNKFLMYLCFLQVVVDNQVDDMTSHNTRYTSHALTYKVFANMQRIRKGFSGVETPLFALMLVPPQPQAEDEEEDENPLLILLWVLRRMHPNRGKIEVIDADEDITLVDVEKDEEVVTTDAEPHRRTNQEDVNAATKGVSAAEPIVFDDEKVTMTMARTLIKLKEEKTKLLDEQIAQKLHDEEVKKATARDKQEKDDMERAQVLHKQYDDKEENIDWGAVAEQKLYTDYRVHHVSSTRRHGIFMLTEKDYPLSNAVMILMLSRKLQVEEDNEMARDLVMKANKPKSRSLDTSSN
nr:uncharacterized mitochondrial protein AtMg00810-like [Tanacetum cinerariifolium]